MVKGIGRGTYGFGLEGPGLGLGLGLGLEILALTTSLLVTTSLSRTVADRNGNFD